MPMTLQKHCLDADQIFEIPDFFSPDECANHVALSEKLGYDEAPITTAAGFVMRKDVPDNLRVINDDIDLAQSLYERLAPLMPPIRLVWSLAGLNERFRYYRYDVGQKFEIHRDGAFHRNADEMSLFTFMVYLNDEFEGGETKFYVENGRLRVSVTPETGKALVFWHPQLHEGAPVRKGRKYVLRSDVMYRRSRAES
jgi:predicted 2-oxoglutarate/Fe(II)-dependent dioxygenase YbiX